ncbi:MAG: class I SAM-dependent methyltransferase [Sulfolobaceae archaeon]
MELFNDPASYRKWYEIHYKIYESEKKAIKALGLVNCLDIGSGPGIFKDVLGEDSILLDISEFVLKEAKGERVQADAHYMPFRDNGIKCAFISVTLCFLENLEKFIIELYRITKQYIGICIIPRDSQWGKFYEELGKKGHKYYSRARFISKDELFKLLSNYFKVEKIISTLFYSPFEEERIEEPRESSDGSYLCIKASKITH